MAGKDAQAGGTWLGLGRGLGLGSQTRFAAITNFREPATVRSDAPTRGTLVPDFLQSGSSAAEFLERLQARAWIEAPTGQVLLMAADRCP